MKGFWQGLVLAVLILIQNVDALSVAYPRLDLVRRRHGGDSGASARIGLQLSPLVGGPSWLPVHVRVIVAVDHDEDMDDNDQCCGYHAWDFVPQHATQPETLERILQGQSTPGSIRYAPPNKKRLPSLMWNSPTENPAANTIVDGPFVVQQAHEFCQNYPNRDLHLITNNCWTFALQLAWFLFQEAEHES